jgi:hypothetical protein
MRGRAGEYEIIADGLSRQAQAGLAAGSHPKRRLFG